MTRIIGGAAGGRRIRTPSGDLTRPTSDRVREALFSSLESALGSLVGLRFLDLYAGSGAVGLEAASRGASVVTLVESDRRIASGIRDNARSLRLPAEVTASSVARFLAAAPASPYDVVFLDPPYSVTTAAVLVDLRALVGNEWLGPMAVVVVERATRSGPLPWPDGLEAERSRRYGESTLWYGRADISTQS